MALGREVFLNQRSVVSTSLVKQSDEFWGESWGESGSVVRNEEEMTEGVLSVSVCVSE